jgi:hypothetical protein
MPTAALHMPDQMASTCTPQAQAAARQHLDLRLQALLQQQLVLH